MKMSIVLSYLNWSGPAKTKCVGSLSWGGNIFTACSIVDWQLCILPYLRLYSKHKARPWMINHVQWSCAHTVQGWLRKAPLSVLYGDGETMQLCVTDKKNDTSNNYSVEVGTTTEEFCFCFKVENLKLLSGNYDVVLSKTNVALFKGDGIKYYIALEPNTWNVGTVEQN